MFVFGCVLVAMIIAVATFVIGASKSATAAASTCQQVHGYLQTQVVATGETQGTITQGGQLNGSTQDHIFNFDASTGTYTATFQDAAEDGILVIQDNGQSFSDGTFVEQGTVDGKASTGGFAGGTGSLTFHGSTTDGVHFTATVSGEICRTES